MNCDEKISVDDFQNLFCDYLEFCIDKMEECEEKNKIKNIQSKVSKISYHKIIKKMIENVKLQELLMNIAEKDFEIEYINSVLESKDNYKSLNVVPDLNVGIILVNLKQTDRLMCYSLTINLYKCAILISMNPNEDKEMEEIFNALRKTSLNNDGKFTIDSVIDTTPVKPKSVPEMVLDLMSNKNVNLNDTFKNMDEKGVNDASNKLKETLNSDKFKNSTETANFLSTALDGVKDKLLNITNKDMTNVECFDQIQNIGQEMSIEMIKNMEGKQIDPKRLLSDTQKLAKEIMPDSNIDKYFNMINKMLLSNMNGEQTTQKPNLENLNLDQLVKLTKSQKKNMTKKQIKEAKKQQKIMTTSLKSQNLKESNTEENNTEENNTENNNTEENNNINELDTLMDNL